MNKSDKYENYQIYPVTHEKYERSHAYMCMKSSDSTGKERLKSVT